jgi:hypothetical protein
MLRTSLIVLGLLTGVARAGVIVVAPDPQVASVIQDAIAAASPGDTLLLMPGAYSDVGPIEIAKPLTLVGAGSGTTSYTALGVQPGEVPLPLFIHDIPANGEVRVLGLQLVSSMVGGGGEGAGYGGRAVHIDACAGPVSLADVEGYTFSVSSTELGLLVVSDSAQVVLDACRFVVRSGLDLAPTPAARIENSAVWINASELRGGDGVGGLTGAAFDGALGLHFVNATAHLSRSDVRGGRGTVAFSLVGTAPVTQGGDAVWSEASSIALVGGDGNRLQGGQGGTGWPSGVGVGGAGLRALSGSGSLVAADALVLGGANGDMTATANPYQGPGGVFWAAQRFASLETSAAVLALGGSVDLNIAGEPLSYALVGWSAAQAVTPPLGLSSILVDPAGLHVLWVLNLDAQGSAIQVVPLPSSAALIGASLIAQAVVIPTSMSITLTAPVIVALR